MPLIATSELVQVGSTFLAVVDIRSFILAHHTHTRAVLPYVAPLTANHEPGVLDVRIGERILLTPTDTPCNLCGRIVVVVVVIVGRGGCRRLLRRGRRLVVRLQRVASFARRGRRR
jgi:hypothetical protein